MSGIIGQGTGSKSGVVGQIDRVFVGAFGPDGHVNVASGMADVDLSNHTRLHPNWNDYITESGNDVTIVRPGLYNFNCRVLANCNAGAEVSLYVYLKGSIIGNARVADTTGSDKWHTVQLQFTAQLDAGDIMYQQLQNGNKGNYHHHSGNDWTALQITYLG